MCGSAGVATSVTSPLPFCASFCATSSSTRVMMAARRKRAGSTTALLAGARRRVDPELLARLGDVGLVLEQHVQRLAEHFGRDLVPTEVHQGARPVDRLGDRRRLLEVEVADRAND